MIDGTHLAEQVAREVENAVRHLPCLPRPAYNVFVPQNQALNPDAQPELFPRHEVPSYWPTQTPIHILACEATTGVALCSRTTGGLTLNVDPENFIPVLFQWGPGRFRFSKDFIRLYCAWNGRLITDDHSDRLGNWAAARVYCTLGSKDSSAPGARIRLALIPKRASPGIISTPIIKQEKRRQALTCLAMRTLVFKKPKETYSHPTTPTD